jgi:nucleotide-binding universal stress UspA family protein
MRVLCAIGQRGGPELVQRVGTVIGGRPELLLLHVIDSGPRHDLEHLRGPLRHGPLDKPGREQALRAAEEGAGKAALDEALAVAQAAGFSSKILLERGKPEQVIVRVACDEAVSLIVLWAREGAEGRPSIGPASVGHIARFVLDHASCDVFLLREGG